MNFIYRCLRFVVFLFTCVLVVIVGAGVFFRYVLHESLYWGTELPNFLFMWIVFLGAAIAYRDKKHLGFSIFVDGLRPRIRDPLKAISILILTAFFVFLLVTGIKVVLQTMGSETEALKIPYGIVYAGVPIASFLMLIDSLAEIWMKVRGKSNMQRSSESEDFKWRR
jgi:TRAP-type C4-dicarboxylate transport system permease small subunit